MTDYETVLLKVLKRLLSVILIFSKIDFKKEIHTHIMQYFPEATVLGYLFHLCQSLCYII